MDDEGKARRGARRAVASAVLALSIALVAAPLFTSFATVLLGAIVATVAVGLAMYGTLALRRARTPSRAGLRRLGLGLAGAVLVIVALEGLYAAVHHREWQREDEIESARPWPH